MPPDKFERDATALLHNRPVRTGEGDEFVTVTSPQSLALLSLTVRGKESDIAPLKASETWPLLDAVSDVAELVGRSVGEVSSLAVGAAVDPDRLARLLDRGVALASTLNAWLQQGIQPVTALDDAYPERLRVRLGDAAPAVLFVAGDTQLLQRDGIGIVGSRDIGADAIEATASIATEAVRLGYPVVSGGAKGVDSVSMRSAAEADGNVVGILADSLSRAIRNADNRRAVLEGVACLCTPYSPDAGFTAGAAMGRNKVIYGLAAATVVIASADGSGGTWSGATEAMKKQYGRVLVWTGSGAGPGNEPLVSLGAQPIASADALQRLVSADVERSEATPPQQLSIEFRN